jgi:uncharacterized membrane protein YdjX (TVP38/TMEM64 family)
MTPTGKRLLVAGLIVAGVAVFYLSGLHRSFTWENVKAHRDAWRAWVDARPLPAAAGFFALYVLITGLSIPVGWVLTVTAGALFGLVWGTVIVSFASTTGATLALLSCRYVFRDFARRHLARWLAAIDRGLARDGAAYVILLRLTPLVPFWAVNAALALTALPVRTFWWASQLGMLPVAFLYLYAGTVLGRIESPSDVLSPGLLLAFAVLAVLPLVLRRVLRRGASPSNGTSQGGQ